MSKQIFRDKALERLSSPERLDSLMTMTTPRGWLALAAVCVMLGGALVWGFLGRTHDTVDGGGILLRRGGLFEVQALGSGIISDLTVKVGDITQPGSVVAHIAQPDLQRSIEQSEARLKDLRAQASESGGLIKGNRDLEIASVDEQRRQIDQAETNARNQLTYLRDRLKAQEEAMRAGLINRDIYQATNQEISRTEDAIAGMATQRAQLEARTVGLRNQASQGLFSLDRQIQTEQHQLELLRFQYERTSSVRSPYRGKVVELLADEGNGLQAGQAVLSIELPDQSLDCYVFVPLTGKRIQPGMQARITPAGVSWEEYGYMVGRVRSVSAAPLSPTAMNVYLRNTTLVQQFTSQGGAFLVVIDLEEDSTTRSGFKWTAHDGPPLDLGSGTLLTASITVRDQAPISLVIPALRRWLGV